MLKLSWLASAFARKISLLSRDSVDPYQNDILINSKKSIATCCELQAYVAGLRYYLCGLILISWMTTCKLYDSLILPALSTAQA